MDKALFAKQRTKIGAGAVIAGAIVLLSVFWLGLPADGDARADPARIGRRIPSDYFGLTINYIGKSQPWPQLPFSGIRLWGAIYWAEFNAAPGVYDWKRFDAILAEAQRNRVDVIFNLAYPPTWAATDKAAKPEFSPGGSSPPVSMGLWTDFIEAVVRRAGGRIRFWEVWNEPEDPNFYSGDIATMVLLQRSAFETIKRLDPSLKVITPSSNGTAEGMRWQSAFLAAGGGQFADILGFHGYWNDPRPEIVIGIIRRFQKLVAANGLSGKPIWDTEAGWPATLADEGAQAAFLARSYLVQWAVGIDRFYWYAYEGGGGNFGKLWDPDRGLLEAGRAYRTVQGWLVGAQVKSFERQGRVWMLRLGLADGRAGLVVWTTEGKTNYAVPSNVRISEDLEGRQTALHGATISVDWKPLLLISSPD